MDRLGYWRLTSAYVAPILAAAGRKVGRNEGGGARESSGVDEGVHAVVLVYTNKQVGSCALQRRVGMDGLRGSGFLLRVARRGGTGRGGLGVSTWWCCIFVITDKRVGRCAFCNTPTGGGGAVRWGCARRGVRGGGQDEEPNGVEWRSTCCCRIGVCQQAGGQLGAVQWGGGGGVFDACMGGKEGGKGGGGAGSRREIMNEHQRHTGVFQQAAGQLCALRAPGQRGGGCRGAGGRARELMGLFTGAWWFLATS